MPRSKDTMAEGPSLFVTNSKIDAPRRQAAARERRYHQPLRLVSWRRRTVMAMEGMIMKSPHTMDMMETTIVKGVLSLTASDRALIATLTIHVKRKKSQYSRRRARPEKVANLVVSASLA